MEGFSFKLNEKILENTEKNPLLEDESVNKSIKISRELLECLEKHDISFYESYVILASLADTIYLYSVFSE